MSAPDDAKPIAPNNKDDNGRELPKVKCNGCGWRGKCGELLGTDDEETMWCPCCKCSGWEYT
jgi:hypothetical protein